MFAKILFTAIQLTGVAGTDYAAWCESFAEECTTFCSEKPEECRETCLAKPDIPGCGAVPTTPKPACLEKSKCCQEQNSKCLSCQACQTEEEYCQDHRDVEGCAAICCELGCSSICRMDPLKPIVVERECKWQVVDNQYKAFRPTILEADVEKDCPFEEKFMMNIDSCRECAAQHKPCDDTYMACGGCCGTPWHTILGLGVSTYHTCDQIKGYFKEKNKCELEMRTPTQEEVDNPQSAVVASGGISATIEDAEQPKVIETGILRENCTVGVTKLACKKIPLSIKFECDDCTTKGAPKLLDKCCDKCVAWAASLDGHPKIDPEIQPFVWCSGCNSTKIYAQDPRFPPMRWHGASKYAEYTEKKADEAVEQFIEKEVCGLLAPDCSATSTPQPQHGFLAETSTSAPRRMAETQAERKCLPSTGVCAGYNLTAADADRRLSQFDMNKEVTEIPSARAPTVMCAEMNFADYTKVNMSEWRFDPATTAEEDVTRVDPPTDSPVKPSVSPPVQATTPFVEHTSNAARLRSLGALLLALFAWP